MNGEKSSYLFKMLVAFGFASLTTMVCLFIFFSYSELNAEKQKVKAVVEKVITLKGQLYGVNEAFKHMMAATSSNEPLTGHDYFGIQKSVVTRTNNIRRTLRKMEQSGELYLVFENNNIEYPKVHRLMVWLDQLRLLKDPFLTRDITGQLTFQVRIRDVRPFLEVQGVLAGMDRHSLTKKVTGRFNSLNGVDNPTDIEYIKKVYGSQ